MSTVDDLWIRRRRRLQSEDEWRCAEFLYPLTRQIDQQGASVRKLRLFTAACVRRLGASGHLGEHAWLVEALERQADALPTRETLGIATALREVRLRCTDVMGGMWWQASVDYPEEPETDPSRMAWSTAEATIIAAGRRARVAAGLPDDRPEEEHRAPEERVHCHLARCVFGSPFRPVVFDTRWQTTDTTAIARAIYESRDFLMLPILGDALEEAGCEDADVLGHCRGAEPHSRGCWVVDGVIGNG